MRTAEKVNGSENHGYQSVGNAVGDLKSSLGEASHIAGDAAKKVIKEVTASGKEVAKDCVSEGKKSLEYVEKMAKERPIATVLVSLAAGLLAARLMRR